MRLLLLAFAVPPLAGCALLGRWEHPTLDEKGIDRVLVECESMADQATRHLSRLERIEWVQQRDRKGRRFTTWRPVPGSSPRDQAYGSHFYTCRRNAGVTYRFLPWLTAP